MVDVDCGADIRLRQIGALHTEGGALIITQTQERIHDLNFKSGMLQSWNKVCFWGSMYFEGAFSNS